MKNILEEKGLINSSNKKGEVAFYSSGNCEADIIKLKSIFNRIDDI